MSGKGPKTPSKKQQSEEQQTPSKQAAKKQDADQSNNKTPVKQTPKKEQQTPAKQQQQKDKTPAKQTPAKKQKAEESASETAAPAEPVKQTPVKQTPKKEKQTPAKSQPQQTPSKKQDEAKPAATSTPSANKKQTKQDDKKRKRQEEEKKTQEENAAEEAEEAAEQENGTADEDAEEKQPAAKKQKTVDAKKDKKNKKQQTERLDKNSPLLVTIENLTNSVSDAQLEEALKKKQLSYSALKRVNTKSAELLAASEAEFAKFMKVRTLSVNNTTIVFTSNIKDKKCLVFRNLAHDLTSDELKKYVQEIGTVKNITIFPPTAKQQYAKAAVEFEKNVADSALEFDGAEVKGLPCRVSFLSESNRWIYVTNLKLKVPDADLLGYFEEAGPVDYMFKVGNGAEAVVCYKTIKGAREALEYDGADIFGRPVRIFYQN